MLLSLFIALNIISTHGQDEEPEAADPDPPLPVNLVHIHMGSSLNEISKEDPFGISPELSVSLYQLLKRLEHALEDDEVTGVVITTLGFFSGMAQGEEIHRILVRFREASKPVHVHALALDTMGSAVFSAAAELCLVPTSSVHMTGLNAEAMYARGLLDKIGIEPQFLHIGDYKAAAETFTNMEPSQESRENMNRLLDGLYENLVSMIADGRGLRKSEVRRLIDESPISASQAMEAGLIDSISHRDDFIRRIREHYGENTSFLNHYGEEVRPSFEFTSPLAFLSIFSQLSKRGKEGRKDTIAIIHVDGPILPGYGDASPFGSSGVTHSGNIRNALEEARGDDSIKAVILRVDSPGGSALASEIILEASEKTREKKPLIVSMGNVAASGGYYVSCRADTIFADPSTITGSIGVVGGKMITTGMWDKLGVNWVGYKRGKNADLLSSSSRFNESQSRKMKLLMEDTYTEFTSHVSEGRGEKLSASMNKLAGGRVYTGTQAKEVGLVDEMGGLNKAIAHAAAKAGLDHWEIRVLPRQKNFFEVLFGEGQEDHVSDITVESAVSWSRSIPQLQGLLPLIETLDPVHAKILHQFLRRLELIHNEKVITMIQHDWLIH
jgi:protease-4